MKTKTKPMHTSPDAKTYLRRRNAPGSPLALAAAHIPARPLTVTPTQLAILRFVEAYRRQHFVGPTTEEIAREIYRCKSNTARYIHILLNAGLLHAAYLEHDSARLRVGSLHVPADVLERLPKE